MNRTTILGPIIRPLRLVSNLFMLFVLVSCSVIYDQPTPPAAYFESQTFPLAQPTPDTLSLAVIGDVPYGLFPDSAFHRMQSAINEDESIAWVLHAGDIKSGIVPCWKWLYRARKRLFDRFQAPWVLTLGDNEWTDCHRKLSGRFSPLSRLAYLRELFFDAESIDVLGDFQGQSQGFLSSTFAAFKEHLRWVDRGVMFVSIHVVGSDNAERPFKGRRQADDDEVKTRNAAVAAWLEQSYQWMQQQQGIHSVVILTHADPHFERAQKIGEQWRLAAADEKEKQPTINASQAFAPFLSALDRFVLSAKRPVLLIQGDGHEFHFDQPWKSQGVGYSQFWRLQTFGVDANYWIKLQISPDVSSPFSIQPKKSLKK